MRYWWVNHKQTFKKEFEGGYIWSPKTKKGGAFNQAYANLTYARPGDLIFSFADTYIQCVGVVSETFIESDVPLEFGKTSEQWNTDGFLVKVDWTRLQNPLKVKDNMAKIANLLPNKYAPIQQNGNGNQGIYLAEISAELSEELLKLIHLNNNSLGIDLMALENNLVEAQIEAQIFSSKLAVTEKEQLIKARIGQGLFKINVSKVEQACRLTGVREQSFLIASHIQPWSKSDNQQKLDGNNGLLLSPHVDKLFDRGYLGFSDTGKVLLKPEAKNVFKVWGLDSIQNVGAFNKKQQEYLAFHLSLHHF